MFLVSSSINVSIFHITWLDIFWTDLTYALAPVAQWIECQPVNQKVAGSVPVRAQGLGACQVPGWQPVKGK